MITVILVIHLVLAIALVGVVLLQRSEGGALGMGGGGGGGGGMGGFMTGRSTANLLTRTTAVLAALFIVTSLVLARLSGTTGAPPSLLDYVPVPAQEVPGEPPAPAAPIAR